MTGRITFHFLLFLTGCCDCNPRGPRRLPRDHADYCRISVDHTMCRFQTDVAGVKCANLDRENIDEKDIETILERHNVYRNTVASGLEQRGNPGPQRPAKFMMELVWDSELARIAEQWALQCNLFEKDQCRDVERFEVWQNVHLLDMNSVGNSTSAARLHFHIQSWYDEVEDFDSAEFGYVNYAARGNLSYISFASATISQVGCGRAIYTARLDESTRRGGSAMASRTMPLGIEDRVETLVCNYGPLDRKTSWGLYEDGVPALCPPGTVRSSRYRALCRPQMLKNPLQLVAHRGDTRNKMEDVGRGAETDATSEIKHTIYLVPTMLLSITHLSI